MTNKLRTGHVPTFMKQGVFLFRFGIKEHLDLMRETGILRWGDPSSYGEPRRPVTDAFTKDTLVENSKPSTFIFCCSGFLGENRNDLLDRNHWPPLKRLIDIMHDESRPFVRPWVMPILDSRIFLGALQWSFTRAPSNLQRHDHQEPEASCGITTCEHKFTCGFVDYDYEAPVHEFNVNAKDRDESEFRIMGQSDVSFTWNSEKQNWYPILIPASVLQKVTEPPVPASKLLDAVWRRDIIERMRTDCNDWHKYQGRDRDLLQRLSTTTSVIRGIPQSMKCSGRL